MTKRACRNDDGDCPCLGDAGNDKDYFCTLHPKWVDILLWPEDHYCYSGRQIMEKESNWQKAKAALQPSTTADQIKPWPTKKEDE